MFQPEGSLTAAALGLLFGSIGAEFATRLPLVPAIAKWWSLDW
jgi:hypothetical protein